MFYRWCSFFVILLKSGSNFAHEGQISVKHQVLPVVQHSQDFVVGLESEGRNAPNSEWTTVNIYPKVIPEFLQGKTDDNDEQGVDSNGTHRFREDTQSRQSFPSFVNNGNSVHIQGNFQGSPPLEHLNHQHQQSTSGGSTSSVQQSPLVAFNLNSKPQFNPFVSSSNNPQSLPINNPQSRPTSNNPQSLPINNPQGLPTSNNPQSLPINNPQGLPTSNNPQSLPSSNNPQSLPNSSNPQSLPISNNPQGLPSSNNPQSLPYSNIPHSLPNSNIPHSLPNSNIPHSLPNSNIPHSLPNSNIPHSLPNSNIPHSLPNSNIPQSLPSNNNPQSLPNSNNPQNHADFEGALVRINSKLLGNTTDIAAILEFLKYQMPAKSPQNERPNNENIKDGGQQVSQNTQKIPTSIVTTTAHNVQSTLQNTPLTQNHTPLTTPLSLITTKKLPIFQSALDTFPLTQSQSVALLKSQTSTQPNRNGASQYTNPVPNTSTQNVINIKVPSGSSISNHQHQADMAEILTNLQILTILMNDDDKNKLVFNEGQRVPVNSPNAGSTNGSQLRHFYKTLEMYPANPHQLQARTKTQIVNTLPSYANQFAFTPSSQSETSPLALGDNRRPLNNSHTTSQTTTHVNTTTKPSKLQGNQANNIPRISYPSLSSILQGPDHSNYYNHLINQLSLSQITSGASDKPTTDQNTKPSPTTLQNAQQLEELILYNTLLNRFNNRHQIPNQEAKPQPTSQNDSNLPNRQDLILASILQSQITKKPIVAPPILNANDPYIPAIHGNGLGVLHSVIAQPPAPPPPSADASLLQDFPTDGVAFPVRDAAGAVIPVRDAAGAVIPVRDAAGAVIPVRDASGAVIPVRTAGGGASSYVNIQECLKNTACALILAGIVATGTTAALAIPVLTPLLGAGFLGKRRKRDIKYFALKPEDSIQFVDDYFSYANGTHDNGLTDDVKCIYNLIMNPEKEPSKTVLGSLFRYIIKNQDKFLNVSVHEIKTLHEKPIPDSILQALTTDNTSSPLDILNKSLFHNESIDDLHNLDINDTKFSNLPQMDIIYKDEPTHEQTHEFSPSLLLHEDNVNKNQAVYGQNVASEEFSKIDLSSIKPGIGTFSTTNNEPNNQQHYSIPENTQQTELHNHQNGFSQSTLNNGYTLHKFQPIPPPRLYLQSSSASKYSDYPHEETNSHDISSHTILSNYQSAVDSLSRRTISESQPLNSDTLSSDISNSPTAPGIYMLPSNLNQFRPLLQQHPEVTYTSGNHGLQPTTPQFQLNQQQQQQHQQREIEKQPITRALDFYQSLCHALGEPGIPNSSIITFIAQRCLLFAHAGLVK